MSKRTIVDSNGDQWEVFEIVTPVELRHGATPLPAIITGVQSRYEAWLLFEGPSEIRRLRPYPEGWARSSDDVLLRLLSEAVPTPKGGR